MKYSIQQGIKGLLFNKGMSFLSIVSVSASLIILGIVFASNININYFIENAKNEVNEVRVSIKNNTSNDQRKIIKEQIQSIKEVESIRYKSKEKAFKEMKESWDEDSHLLEGIENPLDDYYIVSIKNGENVETVANTLKKVKNVENVNYHQDIIKNFIDISNTIKKFGSLLIIFLFTICIVLISNTIKSRVYSKREEIHIIKCFGGSNGFIIAPFVVEGFLIGFIGSIISNLSCFYIYNYINNNINTILNSISVDILLPISNIFMYIIPLLIASGVTVGVLGSIISVRKYLKV